MPGRVRLASMQDLDHRTKATQIAIATKSAIIADLGGEDRLSTLEQLWLRTLPWRRPSFGTYSSNG